MDTNLQDTRYNTLYPDSVGLMHMRHYGFDEKAPSHIILASDDTIGFAIHAIRAPNGAHYNGYVEFLDKTGEIARQLISDNMPNNCFTWPPDVDYADCASDCLPCNHSTVFMFTSVLGWDYDHPQFPVFGDHDGKIRWNNLYQIYMDGLHLHTRIKEFLEA